MAFVTDSFVRADAPTLGANWGAGLGLGTLGIIGNQAANETGGVAANASIWTANSFGNDQYSQAVIASLGLENCPMVRASASVQTCYEGGLKTTIDATHYVLLRRLAGVTLQLGSTTGVVVAVNDIVRVTAVGTQIALTVNGVVLVSVSDSGIASGSVGLFGNFGTNKGLFSSWEGGDIPVLDDDSFRPQSINTHRPYEPVVTVF